MSDRRSSDDVSEDTRRLVDQLAQLLDRPPSSAARLSEPEPALADAAVVVRDSARQQPSRLSMHPAVRAVTEQMDTNRHASCWLYGENARERGRVIEFLGQNLTIESRWTLAFIPFVRRFGSDPYFSEEGRLIEMYVRRTWAEREQGGRGGRSMLDYNLDISSSTSIAVLIDEFPARHEAAGDFLYQLSGEIAQLSERSLLLLNAEHVPMGRLLKRFELVPCEPTSAPLGRRVADLRSRAGLDREEVAKSAGIEPNQLAMIEGGIQGVDEPTMKRLALALGVSAEELTTQRI